MGQVEQSNIDNDKPKIAGKHNPELLQKEAALLDDSQDERSKAGTDVSDKLAALSKGKKNVERDPKLQRLDRAIGKIVDIMEGIVRNSESKKFLFRMSGYVVEGQVGRWGNGRDARRYYIEFNKGDDVLTFDFPESGGVEMRWNGVANSNVDNVIQKMEKFSKMLNEMLHPRAGKKDLEKF